MTIVIKDSLWIWDRVKGAQEEEEGRNDINKVHMYMKF